MAILKTSIYEFSGYLIFFQAAKISFFLNIIMNNNELSNAAALVILLISFTWAFGFTALFWRKHKAHALWAFPLGWFIGFMLTVIVSMIFNNATNANMLITSCIVAMPAPLYFLFKNKIQNQTPNAQNNPNQANQHHQQLTELNKQNNELNKEYEKLKAENERLSGQNKGLENLIQERAKTIEHQSKIIKELEQQSNKKIQPAASDTRLLQHTPPRNTPDRRFSETRQNRSAKGMPETGTIVEFYYTNEIGEYGLRTVRISRCGLEYLDGFDLDKNAGRTFRLDRIENGEITDTTTGEIFYV